MYNFENLKNIKSKKDKDTLDKFYPLFIESIKLIEKFNTNNYQKSYIEEAINKLLECSKMKPAESEVYAYLAYCMYVLGNDNMSIQYIRKALSLNSNNKVVLKIQEMLSGISK